MSLCGSIVKLKSAMTPLIFFSKNRERKTVDFSIVNCFLSVIKYKYIMNKICNGFLSFGLVIQHFLLAEFF